MDHLASLLAVAGVSLLAALSPGPDFFIVLRNSLCHSRKMGFYTAFGVAMALIIHLTYTLVGIGVAIAESPFLYQLIKYAGAAYLFYIGFKSVVSSFKQRAPIKVDETETSKKMTSGMAFKQGFLTNLLNPKAAVFFISLFSQFIGPDTSLGLKIEYGLVNWLVTLGWFLFLSFIMTGKRLMNKINHFQVYINRIMGFALMILSMRLLLL